MWKKIFTIIISFVGTFSVVYAFNQNLFATGNSNSEGVYTGRIGPGGDGLNQSHFQKGDRVNTGIKGEGDNDITWLLINNSSLWISGVNNGALYEIPAEVVGTTNGMYALSYDEVATTSFRDTIPSNPNQKYTISTSDNNLSPIYTNINTGIQNSDIQKRYTLKHKLDPNTAYLGPSGSYGSGIMNADYAKLSENVYKYTFPQTFNEISTGHYINILASRYGDILNADKILRDGESYISGNINVNGVEDSGLYINNVGGYTPFPENGYLTKYPLRVPLLFNMSDVVFAVSDNKNIGMDMGYSNITNIKKLGTYDNLYNEAAAYQPMKLRIKNEGTHDVSFDVLSSEDVLNKTSSLKQMYIGDKLEIHYSGKTDVAGNEYVSVLIEKQNIEGSFDLVYYMQLSNKTDDHVLVDTSKFPLGKYKVSIVNETITSGNEATYSSSLKTKEINIVNMHSITYDAKPQSGASVEGTYEFSKNVKAGTKIGEITAEKSAGTSLNYKIVQSLEDTKSYLNFDIVSTSSTTKNDIFVKTDDLNAGTYSFCIVATDENNLPVNPIDDTTKVCTSFVVNKTLPTITFTETKQKDITIGEAVSSSTIKTSNTEASDITYNLSGGIADTLKVSKNETNPLQYDLEVKTTHSGSGLPAIFDLNATVAETKNYEEVSTKVPRKIFVYKGLSGLTFSPIKSSFDASDVNAVNITVGDLIAINGIGDYTYELVKSSDSFYNAAKGADNGSFSVSNTAISEGTYATVKTAVALTPKTYYIQFKVTDSKKATSYINTTIKVNSISQLALDFKDVSGENSITSVGKKVKFDDSNAKLLAKGGSTTKAIEYDYAPDSMQGGVSPQDYAAINKSNGAITPIRTGTIKVQAKRAGDGVYDDTVVYMDLTIDPAEQKIAFNDTSSVINIKEGASKKVDATGLIKSSGLTGVGAIVYSCNDTTKATVDSNTGMVTGIEAGNVVLTATMNKSGEGGYDSNYDTVTATKSIKIYKGMGVTWSDSLPKIKANANAIGDKAGTLTVTDNASDPNFAISSNGTSTIQNVDASFFQVIDNGTTADLQLAKTISASDWASHGGSFKVQVDVSDSNGSQTIDIVVTLDEADNDAYFTDGGNKVTALTKKYGENGNTFTLTSKTDGVGTVYSVTSDPNGVLTVLGTGTVTINKAGSATVQVIAGAGNGYAQKTVTMVVTIDPGDQSIAFKDTTTLNRAFIKNSTFSELAELKETSSNTTSTRTITYTSNDPTVCTIDAAGTVTMLTKGNCDITASNSDTDWTGVTINKVINLYEGMGVSFKQTSGLQAEVTSTNAGASAGSLSVNGGMDPKTYAIATTSGAKNRDAVKFQVNSSGIVSFKTAVTASDLVGKYNITKKVYELYVQIEITDSLNTKVTTDAVVEIKGAPLKASFDTKGTGTITEVYGAGRTFTLDLSSNKGGATPTYQLKNDASMPSDVLQSVDASGLVTIQHANDKTFVGNPLKVEAIIPPSNGYDGETIETEVVITQATQPDFAFVTPNIKLGHGASITPTFSGQLANGTISMTSGNNALATINGNDIKAKTTDGVVTITAIESGDRDYKRTTSTATVTISSAPAYDLVLNVPSATYGDNGLKAIAILNDATGENQIQTWSSSDPSIAEIAQGTKLDESGEITIHKAGTVTISCTQTSTGEPSVTATAILVIDPKPINVTIDNASKYVGETVPLFHATIPTSELIGSDTVGQPVFSCKDGSALVDANTKVGKYDINATYPTGSNPNYDISVTKGILTIKQDASQANWYHLEGATSATTLNPNDWHKEDVKVVLDSATESAGTYNEISIDKAIWDNTIVVETEGNLSMDIAFRMKDTKALSTTQTTTIKIDKTKPIITEITGTAADRNALEELLHTLTNGKYFKPELEVSIKAEDILPKDVNENSKLKTIHYEAYQLNSDGTLSDMISSGEMKSTDVLKLVNDGMYMVCATAEDGAGNISDEKCSGIRIHKIGDSSDGHVLPDINIDINGDGIADINITRPDEKKPYLNIDSIGKTKGSLPDGEGDINVSREGEKVVPGETEPFYNIVSDETPWKPKKEVDMDGDGKPDYRTDDSLEGVYAIDSNGDKIPDINIDTDGDGLPELNIDIDGDNIPNTNIDSDGDMEAEINVDRIGNGVPTEGICTSILWNPTFMVKKDGKVIYATTPELKPDAKESLTDNGITIKPKPGDNTIFLPNYALKVDNVTDSVDEQIKKTIIEITGADSEVKQVFDVSLSDGEKIIQPNGSILVRIPVDEKIKNPRVLVKNAKGEFKEVHVSIEDGYYVFETDYVGMVSIVGDKEIVEEPPTSGKDTPTYQKPNTSVKGTYTGGTGGAMTGDHTNLFELITLGILAIGIMYTSMREKIKR